MTIPKDAGGLGDLGKRVFGPKFPTLKGENSDFRFSCLVEGQSAGLVALPDWALPDWGTAGLGALPDWALPDWGSPVRKGELFP